MAASCALSAPSSFLAHQPLYQNKPSKRLTPCLPSPRAVALRVSAAKLPPGVEVPRVQPKLSEPFLGFTETAEIWNSRACMIGLIGTFLVELVLNKGILQIIGVEVGKGLDLPL
ncbi:light-harvesting complex-like protein OHP1, chloroplastic [Miscanthus floridulus]|uniref:light-harvesting complex-like protein OHP1, chloroplastic n=1 Tax=Miscanthus floridulus TaxID=154761 RepID=UPI00345A64B3